MKGMDPDSQCSGSMDFHENAFAQNGLLSHENMMNSEGLSLKVTDEPTSMLEDQRKPLDGSQNMQNAKDSDDSVGKSRWMQIKRIITDASVVDDVCLADKPASMHHDKSLFSNAGKYGCFLLMKTHGHQSDLGNI